MPDWSSVIRERLAGLSLEPAREAAIIEEIAQHLEDRYQELLSRGADPKEALRSLGGELDGRLPAGLRSVLAPVSSAPVPGREESGNPFRGLWHDLRHAARLLRLDPTFSAVAILSLALGIGANTAIFQLLDAVRLRSLPVRNPQELSNAIVADNPHGRTGSFTGRHPQMTYAVFERLRESQHAFSSLSAWSSDQLNSSRGGQAHYREVLWASGGLFETLGVRPRIGRLFTAAEDRRGCAAAAVLSHSFWQREFNGRPDALGRTVTLERHAFPIVGVTEPGFFGIEVGRDFDVALPLCADAILAADKSRLDSPDEWWLALIGRRKPGWTLEKTSAHLAALSPPIFAATQPPAYDAVDAGYYRAFKLGSKSVADGVSSLRSDYGSPLGLLLGISALVLLIACANLANLLVARASARRREIAVRLALGASRTRLIRQLLAESLLLAAIGAACGVALSQVASRLLLSFLSTQDTRLFVNLALDARLLAFGVGLAAATCLVFGLAPAIQATRAEPIEAMKSGGRGIIGASGRLGARRVIVVAQVALSLVLLVGALLFVRTLSNLGSLDAGFGRDQVLVTEADLAPLGLPKGARRSYREQLLARVRAIPGVASAASVRIVPVSGNAWNENIRIDGTAQQREVANFNRVSPGYFRMMKTPLIAGRDFAESDMASSPLVAVVTETFARKFLAGGAPIGRTLTVVVKGDANDLRYQIVGLVKDTKYNELREDFTPIVFLAAAQDLEPATDVRLMIRSEKSLADLVSSVKRVTAEMSPEIVLNFRSFESVLRDGLLRERLMATLSAFFGFLAALLAMIGLYGVISFMVVRRRNEIGVRMAMGATRENILGMFMKEAAVLLGIGLAVGTVLALIGARSAGALLFGLKPSDPLTLAIAVAGLAAIAAASSFLPALRAASLDPTTALRED